MLVTSREYKVMLRHEMFANLDETIYDLSFDLKRVIGKKWLNTKSGKGFERQERRRVVFLDTPDSLFRKYRLILRQRKEYERQESGYRRKATSFTLKCRCEDRYIVEGQDINPATGINIKGQPKFEEDIAAPFSSRFSRSITIGSASSIPENLAGIGQLFPSLAKLKSNGVECPSGTPIIIVNDLIVHERVFKGPRIEFANGVTATVALIVWSHRWKTRCIAAELSFRYENSLEKYPRKVASQAFDIFEKIQALDWCSDSESTKTQLAYGNS